MDPAMWLRLFDVALRAFPGAMRLRFREEMRHDFRVGLEARRGLPRLGWGVRTLWGVVREGIAERVRPTTLGRGARGGAAGRIDGWVRDLRFASRALTRRPVYAVVAAVTIALGVGANTAIFSLIHGVLLTPLDYDEPEGLVVVGEAGEAPGLMNMISAPEGYALAELDALEQVAAVRGTRLTLTGVGPARMFTGARVTRGLMDIFRVRPALGRDLRPEEARDENTPLVVLSHDFWTETLGRDPAVVGRALLLDGVSYEVIGVAPAGWAYPATARFWMPGGTLEGDCYWGCSRFRAIGRLAQGASVERLASEASVLSERLEQEHPDPQTGRRFEVTTLQHYLVGDVRRGLWVLLAAVGAVLLIACANVANLMLVRGQTRRGEMAVRAALGATRGRMVREVLMESAVLALSGGVLGVALAAGALGVLPALAGGAIPRLDRVALNGTVLLFTGAVALGAALVFGLLPALRTAGPGGMADVTRWGRERGRGSGEGRARGLLLSVEVALSVVLLVGAGLFLRTFTSLTRLDPGYVTENVLRFDLSLPDAVYDEPDEVWSFARELEERLEGIPGVHAAAVGMGTPLTSYSVGASVTFPDREPPPPGEEPGAAMRVVTPGYFRLQEIDILRGRGFDGTERNGESSAYLVNETFVRRYLQDRADPLGTPVEMGVSFGFGREPGTVIGVVEDVRTAELGADPVPEIYAAFSQYLPTFFTVSVQVEPRVAVIDPIRGALTEMDPDVSPFRVSTIEEAVRDEIAPTRFYLALLGAFALLAVVLAAVGLYGVVAYAVAGRTREIGVRVALGADREGIVRMVLGDGLRPAFLGLLVGVLVAGGSVRVLQNLLFGVEPLDPVTFALGPILVLGVSVAAILVPARRAARVDPVDALRVE